MEITPNVFLTPPPSHRKYVVKKINNCKDMFGLGPGPNPTVPTPKLRLLGFGRYGPKPMGPQAQTAWPNWIHLKPLTPTLRQTFRWLSACHKSASKELGALSHQLHRYFLSEIRILMLPDEFYMHTYFKIHPFSLRHILWNKFTIHQGRLAQVSKHTCKLVSTNTVQCSRFTLSV